MIRKYPDTFREMVNCLVRGGAEVFVITDMHDKKMVLEMLQMNGFGDIPEENIHCADYKKYGEFCKAILLKRLSIDMFIDDFVGYTIWDSKLGPAPIRLLVSP